MFRPALRFPLSGIPPQKWQKYSLLADFQLTTFEYLKRQIHRYAWAERAAFLRALRSHVMEFAGQEFGVVKLVPLNLGHLLPNHQVHTLADLDAVEQALSMPSRDFAEVWFCRTQVSSDQLSVAGRVLIDGRAGLAAQTIEQVWGCSPRKLESFGADFGYAYVRASRAGWAWRPAIEEVFMPATLAVSRQQIADEFHGTIKLMLAHREALERLQAFIETSGLDVMSFEFKVEAGRIRFIDWDTAHDRLVLRRWSAFCSLSTK